MTCEVMELGPVDTFLHDDSFFSKVTFKGVVGISVQLVGPQFRELVFYFSTCDLTSVARII